ncbi:caspase domain protein [Synechococcus sp. PCC 7335]|uniref:caspase family protein n=1 Tax=Synechococcus sp. (strain ATCC 29403 / PCC 7335) TaxID=91464 RepID=UPI00017EB82D|nr:caspase family protein [Synechococcus sp. PCC 7335]EDX86857.1 caspase domain protein [Synechococcus sp. PCC 7335]
MPNYWAIIIGINHYQYSRPLMHAGDDALSVYRFFTRLADVASSRCVLLSDLVTGDLATSASDQAVYPDKSSITERMQTVLQQVGTDDVLWIFFSGYGVQVGCTDYLLPIDGDHDNIEETGVAIADLIDSLAQIPTKKVLLILDMSRSQGATADQTIGAESIALAQKYQISLLLSCQPGQFSHETIDLRHGLFTAALLEALEQKCNTAAALSAFVEKRLPELCEHYWRPVQNPASLISDTQRKAVVVPAFQKPFTDLNALSVDRLSLNRSSPGSLAFEPIAASGAGPSVQADEPRASKIATKSIAAEIALEHSHFGSKGHDCDESSEIMSVSPSDLARDFEEKIHSREIEKGAKGTVDSDGGTTATVHDSRSRSFAKTLNGTKLRNWGLLALVILLIGGTLFGQRAAQRAVQALVNGTIALVGREPDSGLNQDSNQIDGSEATENLSTATPLEETGANESASAELEPSSTQASEPVPTSPVAISSDTVPPSDSEDSDGNNTESATAAALIAQANASLQQAQYTEALSTLQQVPKAQRDSAFADALAKARVGAAAVQQIEASMLTDAKTSIQPIQASKFAEAINKAKLIQPGDPFYEEAQQDIRSWSQVILDIADGRATSGNLEGAIAAASVMPDDNAESYQNSKDRIAFWRQRQNSRTIIAAAQAIPRSGQASSYQKGIVKLREVSIEHPEYESAQQLADEWSQRIFSIAQARAAQGRFREAVQAAVLVPAGTVAYEPAQQTIKRWQAQ